MTVRQGRHMLKAALMAAVLGGLAAMSASSGQAKEFKIRVTAGDHRLSAILLDNATARAFVAKLPLILPMADLYGRELVYRFPDPLPANETTTSGYEVGDIVYWTPRHSFVIMYAQNGEIISNLQKVGRIDSGVEALERMGNIDVKFELVDD